MVKPRFVLDPTVLPNEWIALKRALSHLPPKLHLQISPLVHEVEQGILRRRRVAAQIVAVGAESQLATACLKFDLDATKQELHQAKVRLGEE